MGHGGMWGEGGQRREGANPVLATSLVRACQISGHDCAGSWARMGKVTGTGAQVEREATATATDQPTGQEGNDDMDEAARRHLEAQLRAYKAKLREILAQSRRDLDNAQRTLHAYWSEAFKHYDVCFNTAYEFSHDIKERHRAEAEADPGRTFELLARFQSWALLTCPGCFAHPSCSSGILGRCVPT